MFPTNVVSQPSHQCNAYSNIITTLNTFKYILVLYDCFDHVKHCCVTPQFNLTNKVIVSGHLFPEKKKKNVTEMLHVINADENILCLTGYEACETNMPII